MGWKAEILCAKRGAGVAFLAKTGKPPPHASGFEKQLLMRF
jgi:hypothetical protein